MSAGAGTHPGLRAWAQTEGHRSAAAGAHSAGAGPNAAAGRRMLLRRRRVLLRRRRVLLVGLLIGLRRVLVALLLRCRSVLLRLRRVLLLRVGEVLAAVAGRGALLRQLPLLGSRLGVAAVGDLAEAHVRCLSDGRVVDLEVGRLLELEQVGDDVGRHRLDFGVVDPHIRVVVAPTVRDPVFGLGQLPLQLQEVRVALQIRVRLDTDDQVADRTGQGRLDVSPLLARQAALGLGQLLSLTTQPGDVLQRVALVGRVRPDRLDQVRDQLVTPVELDVDLPPGLLDQVPGLHEAVVGAHGDQRDDGHDHQQDDDHGDGCTHRDAPRSQWCCSP